jgi:hypothetical protein
LLDNCLIRSYFDFPFHITKGNLTSHGDTFEGKVLMLMCQSSENSDIAATAASNCCYIGQAKHNTATATIGEQPTIPLSCFNTTYSTPATSEAAGNTRPIFYSATAI